MKRLHFNLGYPKCGSSAVQLFLRQKAEALENQNVAYPLLDPHELVAIKRRGFGSGNGAFIMRALKLGLDHQKLFDMVEACPQDDVILATETFGQLTRETIRPFLDWVASGSFETRFYAWTRTPFDLILSGWNQTIKAGRGTNTLEKACAMYRDPHKRIQNLFPQDFVIQERPFAEDRSDIIGAFLRSATPHVNLDTQMQKVTNRSLSVEEAELVRRLNMTDLDDPTLNRVVTGLLDLPKIGRKLAHNKRTVTLLCKRLGVDVEEHLHEIPLEPEKRVPQDMVETAARLQELLIKELKQGKVRGRR